MDAVAAVWTLNVYPSHQVRSVRVPTNPKRSDVPSIKFSNKLRPNLFQSSEGSTTTATFVFFSDVVSTHRPCDLH